MLVATLVYKMVKMYKTHFDFPERIRFQRPFWSRLCPKNNWRLQEWETWQRRQCLRAKWGWKTHCRRSLDKSQANRVRYISRWRRTIQRMECQMGKTIKKLCMCSLKLWIYHSYFKIPLDCMVFNRSIIAISVWCQQLFHFLFRATNGCWFLIAFAQKENSKERYYLQCDDY